MKPSTNLNVVILSRNDFPNGDAGAVRDLSFAKIYQELGYNVLCIGLGKKLKHGVFEGVSYVSIAIPKSGTVQRLKSEFGYKLRMMDVLKEFEKSFGTINIFHVVDIPFNAISYLKRYTRKNRSKLIHDSVEWYSPSNFGLGRLDKAYIMKEILNTYLIDRQFRVIAISKYLETYFAKKEIHTVRIPVIMDTRSIEPVRHKQNKVLQIVYAGDPAKKDYVKEIILGFGMLSKSILEKVKLNIIGVNREQLLFVTGLRNEDLSSLGDSVQVYGRINHDKVLDYLKRMDFSILLRPPGERYARAGFPTKVVESLACSTPVICNITSDLGDYLNDMENAVIVDSCSAKDISKALNRIINCSDKKLIDMKTSARKTAEEFFDYRIYKLEVQHIIDSIM